MIYQSFPQCILNNSIRFVLEFSPIVTILLNNDNPKQSPYHAIRPALLFPFPPVAGRKTRLKRRKDMFRRYRDLSIFAFIGVYLISIIDAYVDAELSNFDITPDLSMKVEPAVIDNNNQFRSSSLKSKSVGLQCVLRF